MKRILFSIMALSVALDAVAGVSISPSVKGTDSRSMVTRSVCGLEYAPSSRLWLSSRASVDGKKSFISLAYSDNSGKSWNDAAFTVADDGALNLSDGTLWCAPEGDLWLFFTAVDAPSFDGCGTLYSCVCRNPGEKQPKWSAPVKIGYGFVTDKPAVTSDGAWILPYSLWGRRMIDSKTTDAYSELDSKRGAGVYVSRDKGAGWTLGNAAVVPPCNAPGRNDASVFAYSDGSLRMIVRSSDNVHDCQAYQYYSLDNGNSWGPATKFIDNPDRRISVTKLPDGRLLMVKNGYFDQTVYIQPYNLVCYLSDDDGETWYGEMRIASDCKATNPYAVSDADGRILIAYDSCPEDNGEICLLSTSGTEIESKYGMLDHEDVAGKPVLKASGNASFLSARLKSVFAPRKDWASRTLRIGTYNIQYRNKYWEEKRLPALEKLLSEYKFDVFGSQEPFATQIEDILKMDFNGQPFGDVYSWVGKVVSNNDADRSTHYNPIFYRKDRLDLLDWGVRWFTDMPGKAGFGAYSSRQCCWARFRDKETGKEFYCFNSHPDHLGQEARERSCQIIAKAVMEIAHGMPAFLSGDFNADETNPSYRILMDCGYLDDSLLSVYNPKNAEYFSMSNYKPMDTVKKSGKHIDHVFYTPNSSKVLSWELITHSYNDYFGSDHLPIICEWKIAN